MKIIVLLALFIPLFFGQTMAQPAKWPVTASGAMREMFATGSADGRFKLADFKSERNLWGVGPLGGLSGEIVIWNGKILTSKLENGVISTIEDPTASAVFFVRSSVSKWKKIKIPASVTSYDELEKFIAANASQANLDNSDAFPFRLEGEFPNVAWHINDYRADGSKLTHEKHDAAKFKQTSTNARLAMIGFYSPKHKGIFTHHTRTTHIHALDTKRSFIGHVDDLKLGGRVTLLLPVN